MTVVKLKNIPVGKQFRFSDDNPTLSSIFYNTVWVVKCREDNDGVQAQPVDKKAYEFFDLQRRIHGGCLRFYKDLVCHVVFSDSISDELKAISIL
jgi:hypothetical protein